MLEALKALQEAFGGGPLAALVAIFVLASVMGWWLYTRETRAHIATVKEVAALTAAIQKTWEGQLQQNERAHRVLEEATETIRMVVSAVTGNPRIMTPGETKKVG